MTEPKNLITITSSDNSASTSFDCRYFPIVFASAVGAPTIDLMERFYSERKKLFDQALAKNTKAIQITDLSSMKTPPATVRKYMGEKAKEYDLHEGFLGYVNVIPNPIMRGVVTALKWIMGDETGKPLVDVKSFEEALSIARDMAKKEGVELPQITSYTPPEELRKSS